MKRQTKPSPEDRWAILQEIQKRDPWYKRLHLKRRIYKHWGPAARMERENAIEAPSDEAGDSP